MLLAAMVAMCACNDPQKLDVDQAVAAVDAHAEEFARFGRWARRVLVSRAAFRGDAALREALFAPLRRKGAAARAWVVLPGSREVLRLGERDPATPPDVDWTTVRHPRLGPVRVASWTGGDCARGCVLISRRLPSDAEIVVAFRR